jgi:hypothetical protein
MAEAAGADLVPPADSAVGPVTAEAIGAVMVATVAASTRCTGMEPDTPTPMPRITRIITRRLTSTAPHTERRQPDCYPGIALTTRN